MTLSSAIVAAVVAYLAGSIPTSVWMGKLIRGVDVREHGSGNAGATNTVRVLGWKIGGPVALLDFGKGLLCVLLLPRLQLPALSGVTVAVQPIRVLVGAAAVTGHVFPLYASFRGGKGVATGAGACFGLLPLASPICLAVFVLTLLSTGYVSLASVSAAASLLPAYLLVAVLARGGGDPYLLAFAAVASAAVILLHIPNLRRLAAGTERRFDGVRVFRRRRGRRPGGPPKGRPKG
jgi:glycerol-3-phosphate acyltransferase PlsY